MKQIFVSKREIVVQRVREATENDSLVKVVGTKMGNFWSTEGRLAINCVQWLTTSQVETILKCGVKRGWIHSVSCVKQLFCL